ncbi:hypothetical protein LDENG_00087670 [Lucifuga dentata]|nr:hypothetical protein LDENG_00087670 [Lucifuga dentata]
MWVPSWNCGPAFHPRMDTRGGLGVWPTSLHVFCGPGKGLQPCPPRCPVGGAAGVWGTEFIDTGYPVPVQPKPELLSASSALNQTCFCWGSPGVGLRQGCPLSPILFVIFMDRISRRSQGLEGVQFGDLRIASLLLADDVVLLASSDSDL